MKNYKQIYATYEEKEIHQTIDDVREAEREAQAMMEEIADRLDGDTARRLDSLIGVIARAYEIQGFAYAENLRKAKPRLKCEAILRKLLGRSRYYVRLLCSILGR